MVKVIGISLPDWIIVDVIGETRNRSGRIEELIIKGWMAEKEKALKADQTDHNATPPYCRGTVIDLAFA